MPVVQEQRNLGPPMQDFLTNCFDENAAVFGFIWGSAALLASAACGIALFHALEIQRQAPVSLMRRYYSRILFFPPTYGVFAFLSLLCPRAYYLAFLVQWNFEAFLLSTWGTILYMLLAQESRAKYAMDDDRSSALARAIVRGLAAQGPKKHWAVPPLGCCWAKCMRPTNLEAGQLLALCYLIRQNVIIKTYASYLGLWFSLSVSLDTSQKINKTLSYIGLASNFVAFYALMVLFFATKELLHDWNTKQKFMSIKISMLLASVQDKLVPLLLKKFHLHSGCMSNDDEESATLERFICQYLICIEAVVFAVLIRRAFPAFEVRDSRENHLDLVELELSELSIQARSGKQALESSAEASEEESSEPANAEPVNAA